MEVKHYLPKLNSELDSQRRMMQQSPVNIVSEARKSLTEDKGKILAKKNNSIQKITALPLEDSSHHLPLNGGAAKSSGDIRAQSAIEGNHRDKKKEYSNCGGLQSESKSSRKNSEQLKGEIEFKIKNMKTEFNKIKFDSKQTSFWKVDKFRNRSLKKNESKPQQALSAPVDPVLHEDILTQRPSSQKSVFRIRHTRNDSSDKFRNSDHMETTTLNPSTSAKTIQRKPNSAGAGEEEDSGNRNTVPAHSNGPYALVANDGVANANPSEAEQLNESNQISSFKRKGKNGLQEKLEQVKKQGNLQYTSNLMTLDSQGRAPGQSQGQSQSQGQTEEKSGSQSKPRGGAPAMETTDDQSSTANNVKEKASFFVNKPNLNSAKRSNAPIKVVIKNSEDNCRNGSDITELTSSERKKAIIEKNSICKEEWITYNSKGSLETPESPKGRRSLNEENENSHSAGGNLDNEDSPETNFTDQIPEIKINDTKLGEGAYAQVYLGFIPTSGKFVAVKHIRLLQDCDEKFSEQIKSLTNEINLLKRLKSDSIVKYYGCKMNRDNYYIYMEYMPGGSISSMLKRYGAFEEPMIKSFVKQLLVGLNYLHSKGVVHSDLKGGNILCDGEGNVKLADFGASKYLENLPRMSTSSSDFNKSIKGSLFWMAPELLNQERHGRKIDIWSLGCTVIEMASGKHPWPDCKSFTELVVEVMTKKCPPIPDDLTEVCKDFIKKCCNFNKKERPRANELMDHPFLRD